MEKYHHTETRVELRKAIFEMKKFTKQYALKYFSLKTAMREGALSGKPDTFNSTTKTKTILSLWLCVR